jgi:DNA-binding PadR family transcriptional regulator
MHHKHSRARHGRRFARDEHREGEQRGEHREGERRGGHHRHGRGGLGRFFAHGDLRLVILHLVETKPRYGYEIIKTIEELVAGAYSPSPGVIYPTLTLLEELGYVTVSAEDGKKLHTITEQGRAFLLSSTSPSQQATNSGAWKRRNTR